MTNKFGLKFPAAADRARLRPSLMASKIAKRDWFPDVQMRLLVQDGYACNAEQSDVLLEIAVENGFVESAYRGRSGWWYRVVESPLTPKGRIGLVTTLDESVDYGEDVF